LWSSYSASGAERRADFWQGFSPLARWTISMVAVVPSLLFAVVLWWLTYARRF
jgi:hypothetical protein